MWEGVGDRTELQHIDPHSYGYNSVSFSFSCAAQPGACGPASLGHSPYSSIFSSTDLNSNCSIGGLRAPSAGCWFSLPHLNSNWTRTSCAPSYIIVLRPLNSTCRQSRLSPWQLRPDAPVIYTGAFPIFTTRPGSICNSWLLLSLVVWPRLDDPFVSETPKEFCTSHFLERILGYAYTICSYSQI